MASAQPISPLGGLARRLVQDGLLSAADAAAAAEQAAKKQWPLAQQLVESKLIPPLQLAWTAAQEFGVPFFDLSTLDIESAPIKLVNEKLVRTHHALPLFRRGNRLFVGIADPANLQALDEFKFHTGIGTEAVVVETDKLARVIEQALAANDQTFKNLDDVGLDNLDIQGGDEPAGNDAGDPDVDEAPVVRFVHKIMLDAINRGASDIHVEPYEKTLRVRYRQDGILHEIASPPVALTPRIIARIKVMSRMDIAERRVPQDGRIKMTLSRNNSIDFRVSTCPTLFGEKVVMRILDGGTARIGIDALGFEEEQKQKYLKAIAKPYGMVLITGPTGSGKTVSLYTALNILNTGDRNISTVEDPVEIQVSGINQVHMNPKAGLTFATALRAFLRQDPDIIMVGEIRDLETAEIGIKAAQTGHLVLSTLHTNDAPQTLNRLANMGVEPFNIASAVHLIVAQRLTRRLCPHCKAPSDIPPEALLAAGFSEADLPGLKVYHAVGCEQCASGYKGRVGIYQVMEVSEAIGRIIMSGGNAMQIAEQARAEGVMDLHAAGLLKVKSGITSLEEINRVTRD
jgi:type IV pilus assembly protein PilB